MNRNQEDEFVAVRVQDPRIQNEGSWNSYVDFKIFLHTNSKAFTAKTSCVRRRYSEFSWLRKKLQKNTGLVPVPELPGKSFFSFSNEDFLERRRKGLQAFLDNVVHMTVCLSDSQLHLFLQTQLPVGHIQDCVQGHTPYSVTDAILTYASSNWGLAQAQTPEDDSIKEPSLTVSYESMESPAPHQPSLQTTETFSPELLSCGDSDPLASLMELREKNKAEEKSSINITQENNRLEAVVECDRDPTEATFFLGDGQDEHEGLGLAGDTQQRSCQIQTPVEVHSPMETGFQEGSEFEGECTEREEEEGVVTSDTEENVVQHSEMEETAVQLESPAEEDVDEVACEPEKCINSLVILDFKDNDSEEQVTEINARSQEEVPEVVCPEKQVLVNHIVSEVAHTEGTVSDVSCAEESKKSDDNQSGESGSEEETTPRSETDDVSSDAFQQMDQKRVEEEADVVVCKDESNEDSASLPSSNESIVQVSDEDSVCDEMEESTRAANGFMKTPPEDVWSEVEASGRNILDLQMNGRPVDDDDDHLQYLTSLDLNSTIAGTDLSGSGDFSVIETVSGVGDGKCAEEEAPSSPSPDASEETREVQVR